MNPAPPRGAWVNQATTVLYSLLFTPACWNSFNSHIFKSFHSKNPFHPALSAKVRGSFPYEVSLPFVASFFLTLYASRTIFIAVLIPSPTAIAICLSLPFFTSPIKNIFFPPRGNFCLTDEDKKSIAGCLPIA